MYIIALSLSAMADTTETFDYARFTATDNDPYGSFDFGAVDRSVTKWAAIKYRTITEKDSTGSQIRGQLYAIHAEPHCLITWNHTQNWETIILALTTTFDGCATSGIWTTATDTAFRFAIMESNRNAVANNTEDPAVIEAGSQIDIAYIAFYNSEADAKANTNAVVVLDAAKLSDTTGATRYTVEVLTETIVIPETEAEVVEEVVDVPTAPQAFDMGVIVAVATIPLQVTLFPRKDK